MMICANCRTNPASCKLTFDNDGITLILCRACWSALKRRITKEGMEDKIKDKTEDPEPLYEVCDCGCGTWYHQVDEEGYVSAYECESCGKVTQLYDEEAGG